jgi:serine/threonine-protein kinase
MSERSRYEVVRTLGRGGMATVYLARDTQLGRPVALKVLAPELAGEERFRKRFVREARLAARVSHPNIVRVFDIAEDERGLTIALEYVDGGTLAEELARRGRLPAEEVVELGLQLADALAAVHGAGLVHRDVKPQNVLRTTGGTIKLGDFGIARSHDSTALTEVGAVLGTACYLAPEQARGEPAAAAADLYALGVVLYQALTGRVPHRAATLAELVAARELEPPPAPSALVGAVPPALEAAIVQCLALRPEERPAGAAALRAELARALPAGVAAAATAAVLPRTRRRRVRRLAAGAAVAAAGAAVGTVLLAARPSGTGTVERAAQPPTTTQRAPARAPVAPPLVPPATTRELEVATTPVVPEQTAAEPGCAADAAAASSHRGKGWKKEKPPKPDKPDKPKKPDKHGRGAGTWKHDHQGCFDDGDEDD